MIKHFTWVGLFLSPLLSIGQDGRRDTTNVDEVVISENRMQIPFSKQTRNIQYISKEEIAKMPVRSINEVLTYIGGVDVRQRGPFGTQADVSIDGGGFDQTLVLLNGAKLSDPQTGHHAMNIPVPLDAIERIEILRGPAARIYGINALTGAINIVTRKSEHNELTLHGYSGSSFQNKEEGDGEGIYWGGGVQLGGTLVTDALSNMFYASKDKYNGQRYNSAADNHKLYYQGAYQLDTKNQLDWSGGYINNSFGANGYYAAPGDKESFEQVQTVFAAVSSKHQLSERFSLNTRISNRFNQDDYRYFGKDVLDRARSQHEGNLLSLELNSKLSTGLGDLGFGLEVRDEDVSSTNLGDYTRENYGAFGEFRTDKIKNLLLGVGTYVNYSSKYGWEVFPGIDVGYVFHPNWKITANAGTSQRIPTFTDLYLNQRPGNIGNTNLTAERAVQYDAMLQYDSGKLHAKGGYFYRDIRDYIDWVRYSATEPYQPHNFDNNVIEGIHFNLGQQFELSTLSRIKYDLSYNFLRPRNTSYASSVTSKYLLESLKHQALLRVMYDVQHWQLTVGGRYVERELNDPYFIMDLRLGYVSKGWKLYADATNLLDQKYKEVAATPLPGRWLTLGTSYQINWAK